MSYYQPNKWYKNLVKWWIFSKFKKKKTNNYEKSKPLDHGR